MTDRSKRTEKPESNKRPRNGAGEQDGPAAARKGGAQTDDMGTMGDEASARSFVRDLKAADSPEGRDDGKDKKDKSDG
ncbi:hypothetical protein R5H30_17290 [Sulfitobacter sp. D35]|uniref:hypothetical protein n=1 Tax=Sulfitobacter sp. D35 TaxID=3083252 RepID=UPI00296FC245|nr:hypothetical protein [Sulfitobacter sp. D35]MDW4499752.1 hypothetical protein [Sulfitobacter sp. D35]